MKDDGKTKDQIISKLRQRITELEESKTEWRLREKELMESSLDSIMFTERTGYISKVNKHFLELLGYREEEVVGKFVAELTPTNEDETYESVTGELVKIDKESLDKTQTMIDILLTKGKVSNWEAYYLRKDKKVVPIEQNIMCLYDEKGERSGAVSIIRDITDRRKVEKELERYRYHLEDLVKERTKKLKETSNYLENIIENSSDCVMATDSKGYLTIVNKYFLELICYKKEEVIGKHAGEFFIFEAGTYDSTTGEMVEINEEYFDDIYSKVFKRREEGMISHWEAYYLRKDKKLVPIEQSISYLYNKKGGIVGSVAISRDITERRKAEKEVKDAKYFLESVIASSMDGVMICDVSGNIIDVNSAIKKMLGSEKDELIGKHISILITKDKEVRKRFREKAAELFEKGSVPYEAIFRTKDDKEIDVECNTSMIRDEKGDYTAGVSIIRDITERKRAEEALRESEEKYHNLIEYANDAVISMNKEGMVVTFNKKAEEVYGYTCEEILGKSILLLVPPQYRERQEKSIEIFKTIKASKMQGRTVETKGLRRDGKEFPAEVSLFALETKEGSFFTSFVRDITSRKEMEDKLLQSEKLTSLGELAGGVAHDFNNVLAAILGRAQLLKMIFEPPPGVEEKRKSVIELKEGLDVIEQASRDGAETVRRIQEFARKRDDDKHFATVNVNEIIDNALEFTRMKWKDDAESQGIKITIQKELSTLPTTSGSAAELREVVTNLINNAVDAMPQGGEIKIKTYKEDSHIIVIVEDTGVGIPRALRARIFDPFFTTKGVQSTGLGMSVSYGIINRHRGTISVNSVEGQGTTFTIKLPIT